MCCRVLRGSRRVRGRSGAAWLAIGAVGLALGGSGSAHAGPGRANATVDSRADPELDPKPGSTAPDVVPDAPPAAPKPPRLDGPYVGGMVLTGVGLPRVNGLSTGPFATFGGSLRFGEMVLPWLGLGLQIGGAAGVRSATARQRLGQGGLGVDLTFVPLAKRRIPFSLRTSFGFGGGAVKEEGADGRAGYGGAAFSGAAGYTFFPWAKAKRPYKGGGFGLGPELGWIGFTPAAAGRPMSNTIYLALNFAFYFGS